MSNYSSTPGMKPNAVTWLLATAWGTPSTTNYKRKWVEKEKQKTFQRDTDCNNNL